MPRGFVANPHFDAELRREPGVRSAIQKVADQAINMASGDTISPKFATGFYVEDNGDGTISAGTTNPFFHLDEWGSIHNPPRAPLRRAVRAAGARLNESGP